MSNMKFDGVSEDYHNQLIETLTTVHSIYPEQTTSIIQRRMTEVKVEGITAKLENLIKS